MEKKIFIVDDERELCESIKNVLTEKGFSCSFTHDGGSALSSIEKERPDLIILDIMMSGIDGFEVCQRIKHNENLKDIPVILLTVLGQKEDIIAGFRAGADDYLTKPFDPDELIVRIETHLKIKKLSASLHKKIEELKEQERLKFEFLSHISRELSIPLQDIAKEVNLLALGEYGGLNERQRASISEVSSLCSKTTSLLSQFLEIARASSGKIFINIEEFELQDVVHLVEIRCKKDAENKGLSFEAKAPKIKMKTDKIHLIKILDELLLNAIKSTEKGNVSLLVKEDKENDTIIFEVSNTARIPQEYIERIFEKQGWVDKKLGLMMVKKLVGLLRGDISVISEEKQTRFTIILPRNIEKPARRKEDKD